MTYERPTIADFGPTNALRSPMRSAYERLRTPYDPPYDHTPHTPHGLRAPFGGAAPMIGGQEEGQGTVGEEMGFSGREVSQMVRDSLKSKKETNVNNNE